MDASSLLRFTCLMVFLEITLQHHPQVHEEVQEDEATLSSRVPRSHYDPPWKSYNYFKSAQRDLQKWRYYQQQRSDLQNMIKKKVATKDVIPLKVPKNREKNSNRLNLGENLTQAHSVVKVNPEKFRRRFSRTAEDNSRIYSVREKNDEDISRTEESNEGTEESTKSKRNIDSQQSENQIHVLNTLLGKNPSDQLQGLQQLLYQPQQIAPAAMPLRPTRDYAPVTESAVDVPKPRTRSVVVVYPPSNQQNQAFDPLPSTHQQLAELQAQLDSLARAQADEQLRKAQEAAIQKVRAQHTALALAQEKSQEMMNKLTGQVLPTSHPILLQVHNANIEGGQTHAPHPTVPVPLLEQQVSQVNQFRSHESNSYQTDGNLPLIKKHHEQEYNFDNEDSNAENDKLQYASNYAFGYQVKDYDSENDFGHEETNNGHVTRGHYHVQLPDGRIQYVEYTADASGFHAKVTYSEKS